MSIAPSPILGQPPPRPPADNVLVGCLLGCACQIAFSILGLIAGMLLSGKASSFVFVSWGVTQWLAIGPLIWQQKSAGYSRRVVGLIIAGCLGVLLSSACGSMFLR